MGTRASLAWGHGDAVTELLLLLAGSQAELLSTLLWEALTVTLPGCLSAQRRNMRKGRRYQIPDVSVIVPRVPACRLSKDQLQRCQDRREGLISYPENGGEGLRRGHRGSLLPQRPEYPALLSWELTSGSY